MRASQRRAMVFDLDGVLADTAKYHAIAWEQLATSLDIAWDEALLQEIKGVDRMNSLERLLARSYRCFSEADKAVLADRKNQHYLSLISAITSDDLLPGALDVLQRVLAAGLLVGLASSSRNGPYILRQLGIWDLFDFIADPSQVANGKPAPDLFLAAAAGLAAAPGQCIGVEDSVAGLKSIQAAGMFAIGVGHSAFMKGADMLLGSLAEFQLDHVLCACDRSARPLSAQVGAHVSNF